MDSNALARLKAVCGYPRQVFRVLLTLIRTVKAILEALSPLEEMGKSG